MSCSSQGGVSIMTKDECQAACEQLGRDFNPTQLVNDKICYMSSTKKCRQTGRTGPMSSLICRKKGYYRNTYHYIYVYIYKSSRLIIFCYCCVYQEQKRALMEIKIRAKMKLIAEDLARLAVSNIIVDRRTYMQLKRLVIILYPIQQRISLFQPV